jgi:hypothetical protein
MDFIDYTWDQIEATFVKENILGSEFSTKTDMTVSIDYIPKIQARNSTYAATMVRKLTTNESRRRKLEIIKQSEIMPLKR